MSNSKIYLSLALALVFGSASIGAQSVFAADSPLSHKKKDKDKTPVDPGVKGSSDKQLREGSKEEKREKSELKNDSTSPAKGFGSPSGY
jgi:hypothetical protein